MNTHSSGYYSIDKDYNILSYNDTAKQLYPNLQPGVKCYKALMGLDSPCPPCPVALKTSSACPRQKNINFIKVL